MGAHYEEDPPLQMEGGDGRGLRRGAWTMEEDLLLKSCMQMHGEGKWNLVPRRAGLNRCRKSCRLRWLNYLRPNINREKFMWDEIDLMIRLQKLLGNKWSLIAGRLPGRTANDVKNYWNTHLLKKTAKSSSPAKLKKWPDLQNAGNSSNRKTIIPKPRALKPQPRRFKENLPLCFNLKVPPSTDPTPASTGFGAGNCQAAPPPQENIDISWWESLLFSEETTTQHQQQPLNSSNLVEESAGTEMLAAEAVDWNRLLEEEQMGWNTDLSFSDLELLSFSTL